MTIIANSIPFNSQPLSPELKSKAIATLQVTLASFTDGVLRSKQAHWNVRGPVFISIHRLFDEIYELLGEYVDTIAERIQQLGGYSPGLLQDALRGSILSPFPAEELGEYPLVVALSKTLSELSAHSYAAIGSGLDLATQDIYIESVRGIDKYLWFLEAHIPGGPDDKLDSITEDCDAQEPCGAVGPTEPPAPPIC